MLVFLNHPLFIWIFSGCHECGKSVPGLCKKHGGFHQVVDNVIPTYARLTLPPGLTIKQVKLPDGTTSKFQHLFILTQIY